MHHLHMTAIKNTKSLYNPNKAAENHSWFHNVAPIPVFQGARHIGARKTKIHEVQTERELPICEKKCRDSMSQCFASPRVLHSSD